ncbi:hypothetical protein L2E82_08472 [Cichorium intybus]|uniref:Uncharacterized protein n=1 Tax=Cichorium intybus TaxID=13427 RepID=A0ACB9G6F2_CICIN|nr:hypothetical protein L2E82_08472 [Cichorium intybus]
MKTTVKENVFTFMSHLCITSIIPTKLRSLLCDFESKSYFPTNSKENNSRNEDTKPQIEMKQETKYGRIVLFGKTVHTRYDLLQELMDAKMASNSGANFGGIRFPYPFQQATPSFDVGEAFAMVMTAFVALAEKIYFFGNSSREEGFNQNRRSSSKLSYDYI